MIRILIIVSFLSLSHAAQLTKPVFTSRSRIVGGTETIIQNFPYQVSLRIRGYHFCGGAIVNDVTIITAAHCVQGVSESSLEIRAGATYQLEAAVNTKASRIIIHEKYNRKKLSENDIALLLLKESLQFSDKIQPILLIKSKEEINAGTFANVSGWGALSEKQVNQLRYVEVPIYDFKACNESYDGKLTESMICAGFDEGGKDSCGGDSGGPLVVKGKKGLDILIGIVSFGRGCAIPYSPGVYAKVSALREWIDDKMKNSLAV